MKQTIKVADKPTADKTKTIAESNGKKLDGIIKSLESGGMLADPDLGLEALKQSVDELKNYVGNGKKNVANAITAKGIVTATDSDFTTLVDNIDSIVTMMQGTQDATAGAAQILSGYTAYSKGNKVTGNIPSQGARTITPGTNAKTIAAGQYLSGQQTIAGDSNLIPANIKKGVSIFGVDGNVESSPLPLKIKEYPVVNESDTKFTIPGLAQGNRIEYSKMPTFVMVFIPVWHSNSSGASPNLSVLCNAYVAVMLGSGGVEGDTRVIKTLSNLSSNFTLFSDKSKWRGYYYGYWGVSSSLCEVTITRGTLSTQNDKIAGDKAYLLYN